MILEKVRREVEDNKGRKSKKLIFETHIEEESVKISIKGNGYKEAVVIDITSLLRPCVDEEIINNMKKQFKAMYSKKMQEPNPAS
jgi:hypothetical protein